MLEKDGEYGINHLVEHLIFKSTNKRTTSQISTELEITGANVNAWTNYSQVRFYFDVLPKYVEKCAEYRGEAEQPEYDRLALERDLQLIF